MLVSQDWLHDWVKTDLEPQQLADSLSLAGLEVGGIQEFHPLSPKIVVGEILAAESHPRAEKLRICSVAVGRTRALKIVCGAPNARVGLKSPVALIGAELPGGIRITKTRIRDIVSSGMLCSSAELGLGDDAAGILELDADATTGESLNQYLKLEDRVLDIDLTPNRGDCLCISGISREVATLHGAQRKVPRLKAVQALSRSRLPIDIEAPEDCPRYVGRVIQGIDISAKTPDWIRERLRKSGLRGISLAVDITNYVMLELGQPMHAFDLDRIQRGIVVRHAREGEEMDLLDGSHAKIESGTLLIADHKGPVALAGIMGGADTAISDQTRNILLESACFRPGAIAGRARTLGMQTDASHRFERGVDPQLQIIAIHRATELLIAAAGGTPGPVLDECSKTHLPKRHEITLRRERLSLMLGITVSDRKVEKILTLLGMSVRALRKGWRVKPPSHRSDIEGEHDLIEEVARIFGYDNIPEVSPRAEPGRGLRHESLLPQHRFKAFLVDHDYREVITYSFVDPKLQRMLEPKLSGITLKNPIASNMAVMRNSLWPGLITAFGENYRRQQRRIRLFETGHVFLTKKAMRKESARIGGIVSGPLARNDWSGNSRYYDFYDIKADVEGLLTLGGCREKFSFVAANHPALHPGQTARIKRGSASIGWLGALHPGLQREMEIDQPVFLFELELESLAESRVPSFAAVSKFPATTRDLSIVIENGVDAGQLQSVIQKSAGKLLMDLELFDIYQGKGVPAGHKSLSYTLTLQDSSSNLTDAEIEEAISRILTAIENRVGGKLRS